MNQLAYTFSTGNGFDSIINVLVFVLIVVVLVWAIKKFL